MGLRPDEVALLEKMSAKHGGKKAAFVAGLRLLAGANAPSNEELLIMIKERMKDVDND